MGDCSSRPTKADMEQHIHDYNAKNDLFFQAVPFDRKIEEMILEENSKKGLQEKLQLYQRKKVEYLTTYSTITAGEPHIPELSIEIQKGLDLHTNNLCFTQGKPYVTVTLEPKGPIYETFESDKFIPYWFQLFQIKQNMNSFSHLLIQVWHRRNVADDLLIGDMAIKISDLEDQHVKEEWVELTSLYSNDLLRPSLRVRIQLMHDKKALLHRLSKRCQYIIDLIRAELTHREKPNGTKH
ncbi:unnamed protein product [Blepharisma stoltei]|uniref:C2 domain-containing protein n=1 Tax=Blepharisma stoltei TaxID=1481888 RepID=A0AAU9IUA1_9CILI|nr:unnamed protein product [Blepharisma stoltei]